MGQSTDVYLFYGIEFDENLSELYDLNVSGPIKVGLHCAYSDPIYFIYHSAYYFEAYRGCSTVIKSLPEVTDDVIFELYRFCKTHDLKYSVPLWRLASFWEI